MNLALASFLSLPLGLADQERPASDVFRFKKFVFCQCGLSRIGFDVLFYRAILKKTNGRANPGTRGRFPISPTGLIGCTTTASKRFRPDVSRAAAPELPAVRGRADCVAGGNLDAERGVGLARVPADTLGVAARHNLVLHADPRLRSRPAGRAGLGPLLAAYARHPYPDAGHAASRDS